MAFIIDLGEAGSDRSGGLSSWRRSLLRAASRCLNGAGAGRLSKNNASFSERRTSRVILRRKRSPARASQSWRSRGPFASSSRDIRGHSLHYPDRCGEVEDFETTSVIHADWTDNRLNSAPHPETLLFGLNSTTIEEGVVTAAAWGGLVEDAIAESCSASAASAEISLGSMRWGKWAS